MAVDADVRRRPALGPQVGAEQQVPQHDVLAVVAVAFRQHPGVVPAVQRGRAENAIEPAGAQLDVAVGQQAGHGGHRADPREHRERRAEQVQRYLAERGLEGAVDHMKAPGVQHPQPPHAVVQRMKAPQQRQLVCRPVRHIEAKLGDHQRQHHLRHQRPVRGPHTERHAQRGLRDRRHGHRKARRQRRRDLRRALGEQGVGQVAGRLAIVHQPARLVGHPALEHRDHQRQRQVHEVEPQQRRMACKGHPRAE